MWLWSQQICYVLHISLRNIHIWKHNFSISLYCSYFKVHSLNILRRVTMASFKPEQRNRFTTCGFYFHHRVAPFVLPKHETCFFLFFFSSSKCGAFLKPSSLWINPGERTFRALIILGHLASFSSFHLFKLSQTLPVPSYHCFHFIPFD